MKRNILPFSVEAILAEDGGKHERKPAVTSGEGKDIIFLLVDEDRNIELLTDDISVSSPGSQISVDQQREKIETDDYPNSTTVHSTTRDGGKKDVSIILLFQRA